MRFGAFFAVMSWIRKSVVEPSQESLLRRAREMHRRTAFTVPDARVVRAIDSLTKALNRD